jgi:hypothetical protein
MRIIEIKALENGAHDNQNGTLSKVPEGWAMIPDTMEIPNTFPFVNIEVENGVVTKMTEGIVPEIDPIPIPESEPSADEVLNTLLGVIE